MRRRVTAIGVAVALVVLAGACGGGGTAEVQRVGAASPSSTVPDPDAPLTIPEYEASALRPLLLTVGDLPDGWIYAGPTQENPYLPECLRLALDPTAGDGTHVGGGFTFGELAYLSQEIAYLGPQARRLWQASTDALATCSDVSIVVDGEVVPGAIQEIPATFAAGHELRVFRITFGGALPGVYDLAAMRVRDLGVTVGLDGLTAEDTQGLSSLAAMAVEKIESIRGSADLPDPDVATT